MKTPFEAEQEFISLMKTRFGAELDAWLTRMHNEGLKSRKEAHSWLKEKHGFGHGHANILAAIFANNGQPVYADDKVLLDRQFEKKEQWRNLYNHIITNITAEFEDLQIIPKKTYTSVVAKREFAAITIKSKEIRVGMDLGDQTFSENLQPSKSLGAMPRISHMVFLHEKDDFSIELKKYLHKSYQRIQNK